MKNVALFLAVTLLPLTLNSCGPSLPPSATVAPPTPTPAPPTPTPVLPGRTLQVTSTADSGPGTLRQALMDAQPGDTITFDPSAFPPDSPATISATSELPWLSQGHVTLDASEAGVILDGSQAGGEWTAGLAINSEGNAVRGLQIVNFTGPGIRLDDQAAHNIVGGDPETGSGPLGQGNLSSANTDGMALFGARNNTITGNLIGTDVSGTNSLANRGTGMFLQDGAQGNIIGPDNVIAFNSDVGIDLRSADSTGNTITRNSIHDNQPQGIRVLGDGGFVPIPPIIFDFDLQAGTVAGIACPQCIVELFSDDGHEGEVYEGSVAADPNGAFALRMAAPLIGPALTATATGTDGSTSIFSVPTSGTRQSAILQEGNNLGRTYLQPSSLGDLADNRIGDLFPLDRHPLPCPPAEEDWSFTHVDYLGLKWVRTSLDRLELEQVWSTGDYSQFEINPCQDEIVSLLAENDITILYTIVYWDETLHTENYPDYQNEEEIQRYLDYTRLIVRHFKHRIQYYEILNEAVHYVNLADYLNLIRRVVPVIREEDPQAKIVVGGATDLRHAYSLEYFFGVLRSDIMPLVDGVAMHPMYGASPQYAETKRYYYDYPSLVQRTRDIASAHGFSGEYFAEEMSWRTAANPNPYEPWEYTTIVAAKYYARGIVMNLGMDIWAGIAGESYDTFPPVVEVVQNLSTVLAGARPVPLPMQVESEEDLIRSYTFSTTTGDRLVALWSDGVAADFDPGLAATLIFPGVRASRVVGIDVLYGIEQQLVTENNDGDLVIRNLVVKDYPVFLRLSGVPLSP
jgi:hypothetical protein